MSLRLDEDDTVFYLMIVDVMDNFHMATVEFPFTYAHRPDGWPVWKSERVKADWQDGSLLAEYMSI